MLLPGNVLLFEKKHGFNPFAPAIHLIQGNKFVHCATVLELGTNPRVAEIDATFKMRIRPLSDLYTTDHEHPSVAHLPNVPFHQAALLGEALYLQGSHYAFDKITDAMINHLLGRIFKDHSRKPYLSSEDFSKFTCSSLTSHLLHMSGDYPYDPLAEPDDFSKAPWIVIPPC